MGRERVELPVGVEQAAHKFAATCLRDGLAGCVVLTVHDGAVQYMSRASGCEAELYALVDGDWYRKVDE